MSSLKDIHWMAAPLAAKYRVDFNNDLDKSWGSEKGFRIPSKAKGHLRKFYHWALEIDGTCYEVSPNDKCQGLDIFIDACVPKPCPADEWHARYVGVEPETRKIGQTKKTKEEILVLKDDIWTNWNQGRYDFLIQNCQNFVKMLFEEILVSPDDPDVSEEEKKSWRKIPDPISYRLAEGSQATLLGGAAYGSHAAYLAALTSVLEAGQSGGLVAAGVAANTIEGAAAGSVVAEGGGGVATAAGGSQAAGTQAVQASAAGAAHSNTAGAVGVASKSTAAGASGAAKMGFSAKVASLSHATLHGAGAAKAASIGGGMLKVGGTAVYFHPVAGAAVAGAGAGLVYLGTRGKRDKFWKSSGRSDGEESPDDEGTIPEGAVEVTPIDLFELEAMLLEQAETSGDPDSPSAGHNQKPEDKSLEDMSSAEIDRREPVEACEEAEPDETSPKQNGPLGMRGRLKEWRQRSWK